MTGHLGAQERAVAHPEWDEDLPTHGVLERRAGDSRQQQPKQLVPRVRVGEGRAGLGPQPPARQAARELAEGLIVELGIVPAIVRDVRKTARVAQQTPGRDLPCPPVRERELRHPVDDRRIQVERRNRVVPSRCQRHHRSRDERFGHRRQVEHGLGRDRLTGLDVTDAEPTHDDLVVTHHRHRQARRRVHIEERLDKRPQAVLDGDPKRNTGCVHIPTLCRQRVAASADATR